MLGTTVAISKLHCQPSRQLLVKTGPGMEDGTGKKKKTKEHMGPANTTALPMETLRRKNHNGNAGGSMAGTHGFVS